MLYGGVGQLVSELSDPGILDFSEYPNFTVWITNLLFARNAAAAQATIQKAAQLAVTIRAGDKPKSNGYTGRLGVKFPPLGKLQRLRGIGAGAGAGGAAGGHHASIQPANIRQCGAHQSQNAAVVDITAAGASAAPSSERDKPTGGDNGEEEEEEEKESGEDDKGDGNGRVSRMTTKSVARSSQKSQERRTTITNAFPRTMTTHSEETIMT